eukprot:510700-Pleurochrysis_carterae.AAC.1
MSKTRRQRGVAIPPCEHAEHSRARDIHDCVAQRLREEVGHVVSAFDQWHRDIVRLHLFADKKTAPINVLSALMMLVDSACAG